ncbi:unnamed protein product [Adineta steineri]|uniref:F-box domain-containing protein n=1 Tax=Adineta steineri TaxID=433720 RepID=A0A814LPV2_9BILA|nr:unnamed protein product [Adineta steineri]CAF1068718.1 unnamed protein product [Adineta steineri]
MASKASLESLANELLLDLFEFLSTVHVFHAFFGLNTRFDTLLLNRFSAYRLDFRSISKTDFDAICRNHLPSIIDRVISLRLSDNNYTPHQTNLFFTHGFLLRQFSSLRSISLCHLRSEKILNSIVVELCHLPYLIHLNFNACFISSDQDNAGRIVNHIWNLPKLTHCHLGINYAYEGYVPAPSVTSVSLEYLTVEYADCNLNEFDHLLQYTPRLRYLSIKLDDRTSDSELISSNIAITKINLSLKSSINLLQNLFQHLLNLCHLKIETWDISISGSQWERIITTYLPKLKIFQLKMRNEVRDNEPLENQINELLDSFRTRFWLVEHKWFVRCYGQSQNDINYSFLYTLPYAFKHFYAHSPYISLKSTAPSDNDYWAYDCVNYLSYEPHLFADLAMSQIHFPNIHKLSISLPFDDRFLTIISKFDHLLSMYVKVEDDNDSVIPQLQLLLDQAPRLHSLVFGPWMTSFSQVPPIENTSASVYELNLQGYADRDHLRCFDAHQCTTLSRSPLGVQCKMLHIKVLNRTNILYLVNTMSNLQALNVHCEDDNWNEEEDLSTEDELLEWLRQHLPSTCTITRDTYYVHDILLWIR